ncbi:hypothetical protein KDA_76760 [Dictyobacter alpinus]|uniref:ParB-like N-terminal domain-containing protein n=1 Tax=Dictyobacter alpinus TaxID=2014873 RepID=A0A402BLI2_9CHLR|nr:ParB N-terminal domain-containing protein [Dictyobacter alpinus]GCE32192.1 hypothetical protein KDA_76760 [Dictyobacter alpinus]
MQKLSLLPEDQPLVHIAPDALLALKDTHLEGADQAQRSLLPSHLNALLQSDPTTWPPITLTMTNQGALLLDGYHRTEAAKRLALPTIDATIRSFEHIEDAIEFAFQANLSHGQPSSAHTRSAYAYWLHMTYPDLPQTEIARRAGIKPSTVNVALKRRMQRTLQERQLTSSHIEERWEARQKQREQERAHAIRTYVRASKQLYTALRELDTPGNRYWALAETVSEEEKVILFRLFQFLQEFLKDNLPPNLLKELGTPARRTKSKDQGPTEEP